MEDRFAELLGKGKAGLLTPQEAEELARFLNAPIFGSPGKPWVWFVSKHRMLETDVPARLRAIEWFARCGDPLELDLTMDIRQVKTWPAAMKSCRARAWGNATLEARNQLTTILHRCDSERYQRWNEVTEQLKKAFITPLVRKVWQPYQKCHQLDIAFVHCVRWDILSALMENAYMSSRHGSFFFLELLFVYEAGHFPCGWRGKWPHGELIVY